MTDRLRPPFRRRLRSSSPRHELGPSLLPSGYESVRTADRANGVPSLAKNAHWLIRLSVSVEARLVDPVSRTANVPLLLTVACPVAVLVTAYHAVAVASEFRYDEPTAIWLGLFLNWLAVVTFMSAFWCTPIAICLGHANPHRTEDAPSVSRIRHGLLSDAVRLHSATTRRMILLAVVSFLVNFVGEIGIFLSAQSDEYSWSSVPFVATFVLYLLAAGTCTALLTLGSAYLTLAHNLYADQLAALAAMLERQTRKGRRSGHRHRDVPASDAPNHEEEDSDTEEFGTVVLELTAGDSNNDEQQSRALISVNTTTTSSSSSTSTSSNGNVRGSERRTDITVTPIALVAIHGDFRRRQQQLSTDLHRRIVFGVVVLVTETVIMVYNGYVDNAPSYSVWTDLSIVATFIGNSVAVSSVAFAMGRCLYISREEVAYAATQWALGETSSTQARDVAEMMRAYPVQFNIGIFDLGQDVVLNVILLLAGLATVFVGIHMR